MGVRSRTLEGHAGISGRLPTEEQGAGELEASANRMGTVGTDEHVFAKLWSRPDA
jgi:hypothetical protein